LRKGGKGRESEERKKDRGEKEKCKDERERG